MYYPGTSGLGEGEHQAAFQPSHHLGGPPATGAELGPSAVMQTLQDYFGQPVDMQQHEGEDTGEGGDGDGVGDGVVGDGVGGVGDGGVWFVCKY